VGSRILGGNRARECAADVPKGEKARAVKSSRGKARGIEPYCEGGGGGWGVLEIGKGSKSAFSGGGAKQGGPDGFFAPKRRKGAGGLSPPGEKKKTKTYLGGKWVRPAGRGESKNFAMLKRGGNLPFLTRNGEGVGEKSPIEGNHGRGHIGPALLVVKTAGYKGGLGGLVKLVKKHGGL